MLDIWKRVILTVDGALFNSTDINYHRPGRKIYSSPNVAEVTLLLQCTKIFIDFPFSATIGICFYHPRESAIIAELSQVIDTARLIISLQQHIGPDNLPG